MVRAGTRKISLLTDLVKYYRTDKKDSTIPRFFISCHATILLNPETCIVYSFITETHIQLSALSNSSFCDQFEIMKTGQNTKFPENNKNKVSKLRNDELQQQIIISWFQANGKKPKYQICVAGRNKKVEMKKRLIARKWKKRQDTKFVDSRKT